MRIRGLIPLVLVLLATASARGADPRPLAVLMLGDEGHHRPAVMHNLIRAPLAKEHIDLAYTADVNELNPERLSKIDCLFIYRDSGELPRAAETALVDFVNAGKGLVAVHCASHCFRNSPRYTALVGGRFDHHGTGEFRAKIIDAQHPAMRGVASFETWDETYVHNELSTDRRVLMARENEGGYEPYTWVRDQGEGRVYYTALGHDERTWRTEGFQRLLAAAVRWAAGRANDDLPPPELVDAAEGLPSYIAGKKWGTEADRQRRMPKPLPPAQSLRHAHLPEGFNIELFAAEPDVVKPIAMSFDERGRLWVAESLDYPNTLRDNPHENGQDRIKICEDTDGDGRADRFTIFADQLNIPMSVLPVRGGAIVAVSPHLLLLEDTDGDDRADRRTVLFTGFGRRDTHAVTSNLHHHHDNWVYATVGYSGGNVKVNDVEHSFKQGLFRFRPNGSDFEVLTSTSNNTWGLGINEAGDIFASTANNEHSVFLAIPNRHFESVRGWHAAGSAGIEDHKHYQPIAADVRQMDWHGGFTAATGHELYTARSFPREYWDRAALVCEPTGHLVHLDWLVSQGSSFVARDGINLLASTDPWSAPIAAQVGPDGAVWVLDWYNYVVQHNPTPHGYQTGPGNAYETTLRDKSHGRVYRIVHRDAVKSAPVRLKADDTDALLAALGHENLFWRLQAQRMLVDRGSTDIVPRLAEIAAGNANSAATAHALWVLAGLRDRAVARKPVAGGKELDSAPIDRVLREQCVACLASDDATVRRTALRLLPRDRESIAAILAAGCLTDPRAPVQRDALLALAEMPGDRQAAKALIETLSQQATATDRWLSLAATSAAARGAGEFLTAASRSVFAKANEGPSAERAIPAPLVAAVRVVAEHYARGKPGAAVREVLAEAGNADRAIAAATVAGLAAGWPNDGPLPVDAALTAALGKLFARLPGADGLPVITLANRWGAGESLREAARDMRAGLLRDAADTAQPVAIRRAAIDGALALAPDTESIAAIVALVTPRTDPDFAASVLDALGQSTSPEVGKAIVQAWQQFSPAAQTKAGAVLLRRPEWTQALLAAIADEQIPLRSLNVELEGRLTHHPDAALRAEAVRLLERGGRLSNPDRLRVFEQLRPLALERGDAPAGKIVFEKNCAKCHRHSGVGGNVGPDLTGMAARKKADILTEVLDPNRSVEGNYQQYVVTTTDGRVLTGLLAAETKTTIELVDAEAKKQVVLREDIDELTGTKQSLMPEGFEKLPPADLVNLLEFLAARGHYFPLPLDKAATAVSTVGMFYSRESTAERLVFPSWDPQTLCGVPFYLIDPRGDRVRNVIVLHSPNGTFPPELPKSVSVPCNAAAKAIHLLSGVSGWGFPLGEKGSLTMTVRLVYADGQHEDHPLRNGEHFADYIRDVEVPGSKLGAIMQGNQQIRYLAIHPERRETIEHIEFIKGDDATSPVVMAVTVEGVD